MELDRQVSSSSFISFFRSKIEHRSVSILCISFFWFYFNSLPPLSVGSSPLVLFQTRRNNENYILLHRSYRTNCKRPLRRHRILFDVLMQWSLGYQNDIRHSLHPLQRGRTMKLFKQIEVGSNFYFDGCWWVKQSTRTAHPFGKPPFWTWFRGDTEVYKEEVRSWTSPIYL